MFSIIYVFRPIEANVPQSQMLHQRRSIYNSLDDFLVGLSVWHRTFAEILFPNLSQQLHRLRCDPEMFKALEYIENAELLRCESRMDEQLLVLNQMLEFCAGSEVGKKIKTFKYISMVPLTIPTCGDSRRQVSLESPATLHQRDLKAQVSAQFSAISV